MHDALERGILRALDEKRRTHVADKPAKYHAWEEVPVDTGVGGAEWMFECRSCEASLYLVSEEGAASSEYTGGSENECLEGQVTSVRQTKTTAAKIKAAVKR